MSKNYTTIDGVEKADVDWQQEYNIKQTTWFQRVKAGVTGKDLLTRALTKRGCSRKNKQRGRWGHE